MDTYTFAAIIKKHGLSTKKEKIVVGEGARGGKPQIEIVETPCVTITLEFVSEKAREINARLSQFQGTEVLLELEGTGRQLNL